MSDPNSTKHGEQPTAAETMRDAGEAKPATDRAAEYGGPKGPEPTRYGDWERNGKCVDF